MAFVTESFQAYTSAVMNAEDVHLPLATAAYADLLALLNTSGSYTFLTLRDGSYMETVKAYASGGYVLLERGQCGTTARKFSYGTCVTTVSPTIVEVIKDIFCNFNCCSDDCGGVALSVSTADLYSGNVGVPWTGTVTFTGSLPMNLSVSGAPSWMSVVKNKNVIILTGTPTSAAELTLTVSGTNCNGKSSTSQSFNVTINS